MPCLFISSLDLYGNRCSVFLFLTSPFLFFQTLIMEFEQDHRDRRWVGLYEKISSKYHQYRAKHRAMANIYHQYPEFQVFHEGLKQRKD